MIRAATLIILLLVISCAKKNFGDSQVSALSGSALYPNSMNVTPRVQCFNEEDPTKTFIISIVPWQTPPVNCLTDSATRPDFCQRAPKRNVTFNWEDSAPISGTVVENPAIGNQWIPLFRSDYSIVLISASISPTFVINYDLGQYLAILHFEGKDIRFACNDSQ